MLAHEDTRGTRPRPAHFWKAQVNTPVLVLWRKGQLSERGGEEGPLAGRCNRYGLARRERVRAFERVGVEWRDDGGGLRPVEAIIFQAHGTRPKKKKCTLGMK